MEIYKGYWILLLFLQQVLSSWVPKIVWTYWQKSIQSQNHLIKALHNNHIQRLGEGWEIRYFNKQTFPEWANRIPKLKQAYEHPFWQDLGYKQRIDLVKLAILGQEGGVYIDMTVIMTQSLDWLLNISNNELIENKYGNQPNIFYTYSKNSYRQKYFDQQTKQSFLINPLMQMFFIASKMNNSYLIQLVDFIIDMKIQTYYEYRYLDKASVFLDIARNEQIQLNIFNEKQFEISIAGHILLKRKQEALDRVWHGNQIGARPLIVKDLRIWTIDSMMNAYSYFQFNQGYVKPFITTNRKMFKVGDKLAPFVRFWDGTYVKFLTFLSFDFQNNCHEGYYILKESILYEYVLKDYPFQFYKNPVYDQQTYEYECLKYGKALPLSGKVNKVHQQLQKIQESFNKLQEQAKQMSVQNNNIDYNLLAAKQSSQQYSNLINILSTQKQKKQQILTTMKSLPQPNPSQLLILKSQILSSIKTQKQNTQQYEILSQTIKKIKDSPQQLSSLHKIFAQQLQKIKIQKNQTDSIVIIYSIVLVILSILVGFMIYLFRKVLGRREDQMKGIWDGDGDGNDNERGRVESVQLM